MTLKEKVLALGFSIQAPAALHGGNVSKRPPAIIWLLDRPHCSLPYSNFSLTKHIFLSNSLGKCFPGEREMSDWKSLYQAAILETDWSKIEEHIHAADSAISARLHEFSLNHGGTPEENQAIRDAVNGLSALRRDVAVWKSKTAK
jgi:hypothetical protein